jgi:exodeoxyribonuclease VII small subunit
MSEPEPDSEGFNKNYRVLRETADRLSRQEEPDIDQLVPRVERAMRAYRICKDRRDRVRETLGQYLAEDGPQAGDGRPAVGLDGAAPPSRPSWTGRDGDGYGSPF